MRRPYFLILIVMVLIGSPTLGQSNTPKAEVYIPIPGYLILDVYSADDLNAEDGGIMTVNTVTGELQMLAINEPGIATYLNPIEDFQRQRVFYEQFQTQFILHNLSSNTQEFIAVPSDYKDRSSHVVGITDNGNGLLLQSFVVVGEQNDQSTFEDSFEILNLSTNTRTPVLAYNWGQALPEFGVPPELVYRQWATADLNPVNSSWIAYQITAMDPDIASEYDPPPGSWMYLITVFNRETGQTVVLNDLFPGYQMQVNRLRWSHDGQYLYFDAINPDREYIELFVALDENGNVRPDEQILSNSDWDMFDWLGIDKLLVIYNFRQNSEDLLFQIGHIENGAIVLEDFLSVPTDELGINYGGNWGTWLLTATPEEQAELACELNPSDCQ